MALSERTRQKFESFATTLSIDLYSKQSLCRRYVADECYIVALDDNPTDLAPGALFAVNLGALVQHNVHELVEADDLALDAQVGVLVQPHFHTRLRLKEFEDQELVQANKAH